MATRDEILSDMLTALSSSEPDLDVGVGSLPRKMFDPVAEAIAERDMDSHLYTYSYDIDAKNGADLDEMVRVFGFTRLPAKRASGEVTFSRTNPSAAAVRIPLGTQVQTDPTITPVVVCQTIVDAVIPVGQTTVTVPAVVVDGGARGNVAAANFTVRRTALPGITAINNINSFTGGTNAEDDVALRSRFKKTVFRSLAGTEAMYRGIALDVPEVTHANVVGSVKRWRERIEVVAGTATSTVQDAAYIIPESAMLGGDLSAGSILREGVHYDFTYGVPYPVVSETVMGSLPDGLYDLEFEYVPTSSRNDVANGITNRVDIYIRGERLMVDAHATLVHLTARKFNNTGGDPLLRTKFQRSTEANPTNGNFFIPYPLCPVVTAHNSNTLTINGINYTKDTHWWLVHDVTKTGMSPRSFDGIELKSNANGSGLTDPPDGQSFAVTFTYNAAPAAVLSAINSSWRLTNQDVWVHVGQLKRLRFNFVVILTRGYTQAQVETDVEAALTAFIDGLGFDSSLQASDILSVAHGVSGVDSIRFSTDSDDATHYAIQRYSEAGTLKQTFATGSTPKRTTDVLCGDGEIPVFDGLIFDVRGQNSWGSL